MKRIEGQDLEFYDLVEAQLKDAWIEIESELHGVCTFEVEIWDHLCDTIDDRLKRNEKSSRTE